MSEFDGLDLLGLFSQEVEGQVVVLNDGLVALERDAAAADIDELMRAAHSVKGAARIVGLEEAVGLSHAMEDYFLAASEGTVQVAAEHIDVLLRGVDILQQSAEAESSSLKQWLQERSESIARVSADIRTLAEGGDAPSGAGDALGPASGTDVATIADTPEVDPSTADPGTVAPSDASDRVVRITSARLDRLMGMAGEVVVDTRWLRPFADSLLQLRSAQSQLSRELQVMRQAIEEGSAGDNLLERVGQVQRHLEECRLVFSDRLEALEAFARRSTDLSDRLYREVVDSRMRPFSDCTQGLARMTRDVSRQLQRKVRLDIVGGATDVDRDILERLEAPLGHLLRNAIDHGIESPEERFLAGKPEEGVIRLEARHAAGMLSIVVADDGRGVDLEGLRQRIVERGLADAGLAASLSDPELLDFLYLPGFSTASAVTDVSGRGVGMDVVQTMVQQVGGVLHTTTESGSGTTVHLQLPLTLSVTPTLQVEIADELYAVPMARVERVLTIPHADVETIEGKQYVTDNGTRIGLVPAHQILELPAPQESPPLLPIVVVSDRMNAYGLVVDRFCGEQDLVVRPLDPRLGKTRDISAAAFAEDGASILLLDVDDVVRSIDDLIQGGRMRRLSHRSTPAAPTAGRRILVVDDSITVREVERKLLEARGYQVETAVDGVDGWNALREGQFDLIITDVDMPRMTGIELVTNIKGDPRLQSLPVMIVSYKDREEDRLAGLEAGANYYLTKSSFHDETLLDAVADLIG